MKSSEIWEASLKYLKEREMLLRKWESIAYRVFQSYGVYGIFIADRLISVSFYRNFSPLANSVCLRNEAEKIERVDTE